MESKMEPSDVTEVTSVKNNILHHNEEGASAETPEDSIYSVNKEDADAKKDNSQTSLQNIISLENKGQHETKSVKIIKVTKKLKLDIGDSSQTLEKKESKDDTDAEAKTMRSLKRSCELWSMEDKNTFFKAINEYSKDFDALQNYFLTQGKKKGIPEKMIKNKEQIRHFYYRTWLKISKHLKFSDDVKKTTQELYGLINYGELRRKLPRMHEKVQKNLNELVYWGSTAVRLRGKTTRIKTPICRSLRKLNHLEDWQEDIKLPSRVTVELRPGNNYTWWKVQGLAMNPRVRTVVPIQRRLSSILAFLQQRWKPWRPKVTGVNGDQTASFEKNNLLRVAPLKGCKISLPVVNLGEYLTSNSVSFNSYEKRHSLKSSKLHLLGNVQGAKGVGKRGFKKCKTEKKLEKIRIDETIPDSSDLDVTDSNIFSVNESAANSTNHLDRNIDKQPVENGFPGRESVERIKQGWNVEEANTINVGDLFLMLGQDSKIVLEYWWESKDAATEEKSRATDFPEISLSFALQKLLSIAKHSYATIKGYDNVSGSNETIVSSRIPYTKESTFRRPLIPQPYQRIGSTETFKTQLDRYKTRHTRRGKFLRQRNLVVQRVLPAPLEPSAQQNSYTQDISVGDKTITVIIPPNDAADVTKDLIEVGGKENCQKPFADLGQDVEALKLNNSNSSITSAMQILKEGEQQWLNSEVADFSLSSFLGQLESPVKPSQRNSEETPMIGIVRPSSDVANMQSIIGENSIDYIAKFANYASQIVSSDNLKKD